jgi:hypothetical protein
VWGHVFEFEIFFNHFKEFVFYILPKKLIKFWNKQYLNTNNFSSNLHKQHNFILQKYFINNSDIKNWRPLTLLNCDYKIISKLWAERLKNVSTKLIHLFDCLSFTDGLITSLFTADSEAPACTRTFVTSVCPIKWRFDEKLFVFKYCLFQNFINFFGKI